MQEPTRIGDALARWASEHAAALRTSVLARGDAQILLAGFTVAESAALLQSLQLAVPLGSSLGIALYWPLGDAGDPLRFWIAPEASAATDGFNDSSRRADEEAMAVADLTAALADTPASRLMSPGRAGDNTKGLHALPRAQFPTISSLPRNTFDAIFFGPAAFAVLDGGAGASDAAMRADMAVMALSKTRAAPLPAVTAAAAAAQQQPSVPGLDRLDSGGSGSSDGGGNGLVVLMARSASAWQRIAFGAAAEDMSSDVSDNFAARVFGDGALPFTRYSVEAELQVMDSDVADNAPRAREALRRLAAAQTSGVALETGAAGNVCLRDASVEQDVAPHDADLSSSPSSFARTAQGALPRAGKAPLLRLPERATVFALGACWAMPFAADATAAASSAAAAAAAAVAASAEDMRWWPQGRGGDFVNAGLEEWHRSRAAWLQPRGDPDPAPPEPVPYEELVAGLANLRRTYELPRPMRLPDLIDVYLDLWDSQDGY